MTARSRRPVTFADVLRRQRQAARLTQAELAARAGLGERTVSNLERGINRSPYPNTIRLLADALDLDETARVELAAAARTTVNPAATAPPIGSFLGAEPGTPIVARVAERNRIGSVVASATAGTGRAVFLAGEPGIGKTRLAQETASVAGRAGFLVAVGRCYEATRGTPFAPFLEAIATLYAAAPRQLRESLEQRWPAMLPLLPDEFPAAPAKNPSAPDELQRLYRAVTAFVRELAAQRPVAILLDDLHWADGASLELLAHLTRHTSDQRLLLLGTLRNVGVPPTHPVRELVQTMRREGLAETITVERLEQDAIAHVITDQLDGAAVTDEFVALIHRHGQGNPFFTVEIVLALIERGDLSHIDGNWVRRELSDLEAPNSVSDAIKERVARLSAAAQDVLDAAAVIGEVVHVEDLAIVGLDEPTLETALDEAVAAGLLYFVSNHYAFDHVLTHQALYAALSPIRRRRLHRATADQLEKRTQQVQRRRAADIARHFEASGAVARAIPHVLIAGDTAVEVHAHVEALLHYRHATELADEVEDSAALAEASERVGRVLMTTGQHQAAIEPLLRAADAYQLVGDHDAWLRAEGLIAQAHHGRGAGEAAADRLAAVIAELHGPLGSEGQHVGAAVLGNGLARVRLALRQHEAALHAADRAAELARAHGVDAVEADVEATRGTTLLFVDRPDDALAALEQSASLAARANAATAERDALLGLQWQCTIRGSFARAIAAGQRGLNLSRQSGDADARALHDATLGLTYFYCGDWASAAEHLERSVELSDSGAPTLFSGIPPAYLGLLRRGEGDLAAAEHWYGVALTAPDLQTFAFDAYLDARLAELDLLRNAPYSASARLERWLADDTRARPHEVMLLCIAAEASFAGGTDARGRDLTDQAVSRAAATRNETDGVDAFRLQARGLLRDGRIEEARTLLHRTLARADQLPHPFAVGRLHRELAQVALIDGRPDLARRHASLAVSTFTDLGARHDAATTADDYVA